MTSIHQDKPEAEVTSNDETSLNHTISSPGEEVIASARQAGSEFDEFEESEVKEPDTLLEQEVEITPETGIKAGSSLFSASKQVVSNFPLNSLGEQVKSFVGKNGKVLGPSFVVAGAAIDEEPATALLVGALSFIGAAEGGATGAMLCTPGGPAAIATCGLLGAGVGGMVVNKGASELVAQLSEDNPEFAAVLQEANEKAIEARQLGLEALDPETTEKLVDGLLNAIENMTE